MILKSILHFKGENMKKELIRFLSITLIVTIILEITITSCSKKGLTTAEKTAIINKVISSNQPKELIMSLFETTKTELTYNKSKTNNESSMLEFLLPMGGNSTTNISTYFNTKNKEISYDSKTWSSFLNSTTEQKVIIKNNTVYTMETNPFSNKEEWYKEELNKNDTKTVMNLANEYTSLTDFLKHLPKKEIEIKENNKNYIIFMNLSQKDIFEMINTLNNSENDSDIFATDDNSNTFSTSKKELSFIEALANITNQEFMNMQITLTVNKDNYKISSENETITLYLSKVYSMMASKGNNQDTMTSVTNDLSSLGLIMTESTNIKIYDYGVVKNITLPKAALNATNYDDEDNFDFNMS